MASLDELIVKIKGDISDFKKKVEQASTVAKTGFGKIQSALSDTSSSFNSAFDKISQFRGAISAVVAAGGLASLAKASLDAADQINDLSINTGVSTATLQGLGFAAKLSGSSAEQMNAALLKLNNSIGQAGEGSEATKQVFNKLGVAIKEADGTMRNTEDIVFDVADGIQKLGSEAEQTAALVGLFGRSGAQMLGVFKEGAAGMKAFVNQAREMGLVIDDGLIKGAAAANDQLDILSQVISTQFTKSILEAAPAIQKIAEGLTSMIVPLGSLVSGYLDLNKSLANTMIYMYSLFTGKQNLTKATIELIAEEEKSTKATKLSAEEQKKLNEEAKTRAQNLKRLQDIQSAEAAQQEKILKITEAVGMSKEQQILNEIALLEGRNEQVITKEDQLKNAIMAKRAELEEMKNSNNLAEINRTFERISMLQELDAEANAKEIEDLTAHIETKKAMLSDLDKFKTDSKIKDVKETQETAEAMNEIDKWLQSEKGKNFQSTMQFLQMGARSGNKELATIAKAAAITQATIDTYKGVAAALGSGPPPLNFILAAAVGAVGAANVAKIASTPIELNSGVTDVPGIGRGDRVPAMLEPGERVISRAQNSDLKKFMASGGGGGGTQVILGFKDGLDSLIEVVETKLIERRNLSVGEGAI